MRLDAFDTADKKVGNAYSECTNVGPRTAGDRATPHCTQTYRPVQGQIVTTGVVNLTDLQHLAIPIVGGRGSFRGATGEIVEGAPFKADDSVDVLKLD